MTEEKADTLFLATPHSTVEQGAAGGGTGVALLTGRVRHLNQAENNENNDIANLFSIFFPVLKIQGKLLIFYSAETENSLEFKCIRNFVQH